MPNVWDDQNIKPNLKTLASVEDGDKFRILPSGLIDRDRYFQAAYRKDSDSIKVIASSGNSQGKDDERLDAITRLFKRAIELSKQGGQWSSVPKSGVRKPPVFIARSEIERALAGLKAMRGSYTGSGKGDQRRTLDGLIQRVDRLIPPRDFPGGEQAEQAFWAAVEQFQATYKEQRKLALAQRDYTMCDQKGICYALCLDWIRRRLLKNKMSYGNCKSKRPLDDCLRHKSENRLHKLQRTVIDPPRFANDFMPMVVRVDPKFANLKRLPQVGGGVWLVDPTTNQVKGASTMFDDVFKRANNRANHERKYIPGIRCCFQLALEGNTTGHSVAFEIVEAPGNSSICLFDPNLGEFKFGLNSEKAKQQLLTFFGELWTLHASRGHIYGKWSLDLFNKEQG